MQNRVAFITGASSGIGRATVLAFARQGTHVVGVARRSERLAELETKINALPKPHGDFLGVVGDVADTESINNAVEKTLTRFGRLDILVANAGLGQRGAVVDAEWVHLETLLRTNIDGVLHSIRAAVPAMRKNGGGHIITISSVVYNLTSPYAATYAASKAFVSSLANSLRLELEDENIFVTDVLVGRTETEFNEKRLGAGKRAGEGIPVMSAETVAEAILNATVTHKKTVTLRFFDRLIIWGNIFVPGIIGRIAKKQYK